MAKNVVAQIKLQVPAGEAKPSPPVGPALGQHGVNIPEFCKRFNEQTGGKGNDGITIPVVISVYNDRSFTFVTKTPPAAVLLKRAAMVAKGSGKPNQERVATLTTGQIRDIAQQKLPDLNTKNLESAYRIISGTARSMGIAIEE
ncbi:MAG: 50S ribosomal protein L11 [Candidatus Schekmanbacteria bacterium]|nr:50S ribosomal protein L11 [Candidatus Schekmanbacteria bacterium]